MMEPVLALLSELATSLVSYLDWAHRPYGLLYQQPLASAGCWLGFEMSLGVRVMPDTRCLVLSGPCAADGLPDLEKDISDLHRAALPFLAGGEADEANVRCKRVGMWSPRSVNSTSVSLVRE